MNKITLLKKLPNNVFYENKVFFKSCLIKRIGDGGMDVNNK